jgi:hypothetical protein
MGNPSFRPFQIRGSMLMRNGSMLVRRVIRLGSTYICGICRGHHKEAYDANQCLDMCWKEVKSCVPYLPFRRLHRTEFACIYCQRSYAEAHLATQCASDCSAIMEITGYDGNIPGAVKTHNHEHINRRRKLKPVPKIVETPPVQVVAARVEVPQPSPIETPVVPIVAALPPPAFAPEIETSGSERTAKAKKPPRDRTKRFERVGSKYECIICHVKYFTKDEVEACFNGHED